MLIIQVQVSPYITSTIQAHISVMLCAGAWGEGFLLQAYPCLKPCLPAARTSFGCLSTIQHPAKDSFAIAPIPFKRRHRGLDKWCALALARERLADSACPRHQAFCQGQWTARSSAAAQHSSATHLGGRRHPGSGCVASSWQGAKSPGVHTWDSQRMFDPAELSM